MIYTPAYNAFSFTQKTQRTVLVNKDLAKAEKGVGAFYFQDSPPYFVAPPLFNIVTPSFLMLFLLFFVTKVVFKWFRIICKSLKKPHKLVFFFNISSLKYKCPPPLNICWLRPWVNFLFFFVRRLLIEFNRISLYHLERYDQFLHQNADLIKCNVLYTE